MKILKDKIYKFVKKYLSLPDIEVLPKQLSILSIPHMNIERTKIEKFKILGIYFLLISIYIIKNNRIYNNIIKILSIYFPLYQIPLLFPLALTTYSSHHYYYHLDL